MKIIESRAKSFYKLKNIKILKRNINGLREVEYTENNTGTFHKERKNDTVRFLAFEVRFGIRFPLSIFVTVPLAPKLL